MERAYTSFVYVIAPGAMFNAGVNGLPVSERLQGDRRETNRLKAVPTPWIRGQRV
jgi:hypothetical protein